MELFLLLISVPFAHSVKHSLTYFITSSSGLQTFPRLVIVGVVDGVTVGSCNSDINTIEGRQTWSKKQNKEDPHYLEWRVDYCRNFQKSSKTDIESIKQHFHQSGGIHILQRIAGCEWDVETGEVKGYQQFGYDGEDFISFDVKNMTWVYTKKAATYNKKWAASKSSVNEYNVFLTKICPQWLKTFLSYGNSSVHRTDPPSASLLQKTPSSPVSCHATGFYPDRATMFWRKDGEELHEDVDHGEILPNHDGTFQMSVDLNISSVKPEDWSRYDCVFQLSGVEKNIFTKLDKAVIRTNWVPPSDFPFGAVIGAVVGLLLLAVCITGLFIWRKKMSGERLSSVFQGSGVDSGVTDTNFGLLTAALVDNA